MMRSFLTVFVKGTSHTQLLNLWYSLLFWISQFPRRFATSCVKILVYSQQAASRRYVQITFMTKLNVLRELQHSVCVHQTFFQNARWSINAKLHALLPGAVLCCLLNVRITVIKILWGYFPTALIGNCANNVVRINLWSNWLMKSFYR
jgi:hypothetical protein